MLDTLATARLRTVGQTRGCVGTDSERGLILAQFRQVISTTVVRSQAKTLVSRLGVIGERGRDQARKKNLFERESKILEQQLRNQWHAHIRGLGVAKGSFSVPS